MDDEGQGGNGSGLVGAIVGLNCVDMSCLKVGVVTSGCRLRQVYSEVPNSCAFDK